MPEVVDWLADDGLDPAVFESGNHTAMWREIARFEAVLLERLQDWAARNVPADQAAAGAVRAGNRVSRAALKPTDPTLVPAVQDKAVPGQVASAPAERAAERAVPTQTRDRVVLTQTDRRSGDAVPEQAARSA